MSCSSGSVEEYLSHASLKFHSSHPRLTRPALLEMGKILENRPEMPESEEPVLYCCENDHDEVKKLKEELRGKVRHNEECITLKVQRAHLHLCVKGSRRGLRCGSSLGCANH